jgi:16S rRNA U1498 N3-methylase RsmE
MILKARKQSNKSYLLEVKKVKSMQEAGKTKNHAVMVSLKRFAESSKRKHAICVFTKKENVPL